MTSQTTKRGEEQFLGEIQTKIAGTTHHKARIRSGEATRLQREPDNQHDPLAIRVDNGRSRAVGYIPRRTAAWLAPLIDEGKVRVEGYVLGTDDVVDADRPATPLAVMVFLTPAGLPILRRPSAEDRLNNLHALALQALDEVQSMDDPAEILRFTKGLEHIARETTPAGNPPAAGVDPQHCPRGPSRPRPANPGRLPGPTGNLVVGAAAGLRWTELLPALLARAGPAPCTSFSPTPSARHGGGRGDQRERQRAPPALGQQGPAAVVDRRGRDPGREPSRTAWSM